MWADDPYCRDSPISDALGKVSNQYVATGYVRVYGFSVYNSAASSKWVQLFDSSTVPADTAVPLMAFAIAATSTLGVYFGPMGRTFKRGLIIVNSTTDTTKTIGAADCLFDVEYDQLGGVYAAPDNGGQ